MPLAVRHRLDPLPALAPRTGLAVHRVDVAQAMAAIQGRDVGELAHRLADGHRAYVATVDDVAAAWGWVATRTARIGELDASFAIPAGDRYLWNFVTRPTHRGLGIYPRLLDAIVRVESAEADRFWIAYAPENHASGAGIAKAGFTTLAELSFDAAGRAAVAELAPGGGAAASRMLGLGVAEAVAPCWRCARHGRAMRCGDGACRCDYQQPDAGCGKGSRSAA